MNVVTVMVQAQYAVNATNGTPTDALPQAIGEGIGNNAAHEIVHQLKNRFLNTGKIFLEDGSTDQR